MEINRIEEEFLIIKKKFISKISSKSLVHSSFVDIENELYNSLHHLYSKLKNKVTEWATFSIKNLEKAINKSKDQIEPKDYQKLIQKINIFSHSFNKVLD